MESKKAITGEAGEAVQPSQKVCPIGLVNFDKADVFFGGTIC